MTEPAHFDGPPDASPPETLPVETLHDQRLGRLSLYEGVIPRILRNLVVVSALLLAPAFWVYRWSGSLGFALGAVASYINFRSLTRGVEALADRIVNQQSKEKGGWIILRFLVRYGLVGVAAYVIFIGSPLVFRGFLWGLCVPVPALMVEAVWEGYNAFRSAD